MYSSPAPVCRHGREPIERALPCASEEHRSPEGLSLRPAEREHARKNGRAERSGEVRAPFAPIEARAAERTSRERERIEVEPEPCEEPRAGRRYAVAVAPDEDLALTEALE